MKIFQTVFTLLLLLTPDKNKFFTTLLYRTNSIRTFQNTIFKVDKYARLLYFYLFKKRKKFVTNLRF